MADALKLSLKIDCLHSNHPAVSPDGKTLVAVAWIDEHLRIYDAKTGKEKSRLDGFSIPGQVEFSADGSMLAMSGWFNPTRVWDTKTWQLKHDFKDPSQYIAWSPDSKFMAVAWKRKVTVYDLKTGAAKASFEDKRRIDLIQFTADGKMIITGPGKETKFWDAKTGAAIGSVMHKGDIMTMCLSPNGKTLTTCGSPSHVTLWDLKTKNSTRLEHEDLVADISYDDDGKRLATGDFDGNISVWDPSTGKSIATFKSPEDSDEAIYHLAFSPGGKHLVVMNGNHVMSLWETKNFKCLGVEKKPATSTNPIRPANFSPACPAWFPNGKRFAVGGGNALTIYDV